MKKRTALYKAAASITASWIKAAAIVVAVAVALVVAILFAAGCPIDPRPVEKEKQDILAEKTASRFPGETPGAIK